MGSPLADALLNQQPLAGPVPLSSMVGLGQVPTQADAMDYNTSAIGNAIAAQRAISAQRGLWNDETGLPTQACVADAANQVGQGLLMGSTAPGIRAFHGSPHSFDQFDLGKIGTGEGAQAYGHGLYFAGNEGVARSYRDNLSKPDYNDPHLIAQDLLKKNGTAERALSDISAWFPDGKLTPSLQQASELLRLHGDNVPPPGPAGHMYEVNINADPAHFLDWDKPLSEQSPHVQEALSQFGIKPPSASYAVRQVENGHVVDYTDASGAAKTSRVFPTEDGAQKAGKATMQIYNRDPSGGALYESSKIAPGDTRNPVAAAQALQQAGIPGIRYLDGGSRGAGEGTSNYVMFSPEHIAILRKYGLLGTAGGAAASPFGFAAAGQGQQ